jgi:type I restriction enzyme S subunit
VEIIDRSFSVLDSLQLSFDQSKFQVSQLRQAILKTAFVGKLVPQNPNDEHAQKLLERIETEHFNKSKQKNNNQWKLSSYVK